MKIELSKSELDNRIKQLKELQRGLQRGEQKVSSAMETLNEEQLKIEKERNNFNREISRSKFQLRDAEQKLDDMNNGFGNESAKGKSQYLVPRAQSERRSRKSGSSVGSYRSRKKSSEVGAGRKGRGHSPANSQRSYSSRPRRHQKIDVMKKCQFCGLEMLKSELRDHAVIHPTEILPALWLGNAANAHDIDTLKKCGITHVLNCAREINPRGEDQAFTYMHLDLQDKSWQDLHPSFEPVLEFIAVGTTKGNKIFVHCQQGVSRSASFCAAY
eukprot:UN33601